MCVCARLCVSISLCRHYVLSLHIEERVIFVCVCVCGGVPSIHRGDSIHKMKCVEYFTLYNTYGSWFLLLSCKSEHFSLTCHLHSHPHQADVHNCLILHTSQQDRRSCSPGAATRRRTHSLRSTTKDFRAIC